MPDAFESLHLPYDPIDPDPGFARRLRARVQRILDLPKGAPMPETAVQVEPAGRTLSTVVVPYLIVSDARSALDWYSDALGARLRGDPVIMPDGRIGHSELELSGGLIYLADESSESHVAAPSAGAAASVSIAATVADVDSVVDRAVGMGASLERSPNDAPYGRNAVVRDPFGHRWLLTSPVHPGREPASARPGTGERERTREGDVGYASLWLPEAERGAAFYGKVLGWAFEPGSSGQGRHVVGTTVSQGLWGTGGRGTLFLAYFVDDVFAAVERVLEAGGAAEAPTEEPYGRSAVCTDPDGLQFGVFQPPAGSMAWRGHPNGERHGDISYITMEVIDSKRTRRFYADVLGWQFSPGHIEDGWGVEDVVPMTGMHGGHQVATIIPMYRVDDIDDAVRRVREAGGISTDPEPQPYGLTAECSDDQGTRFYLG